MEAQTPKDLYEMNLGSGFTNENDGAKVKRRLSLANEAIAYTRKKLSFGAGNVTEQIKESGGWSSKLASDAQHFAGQMLTKIGEKDLSQANLEVPRGLMDAPKGTKKQEEINFAALRAISAKWHGAGVCDEFAAVTFFYLQKRKQGNDDEFYRVSVTGNDSAHAVVIIADPGLDATQIMESTTAVVADAWPTRPFAVRVSDWKYKQWTPQIKWSSADMGEKYISKVRHVWSKPYSFEGKPEFRRMTDDYYTDVKNQKLELRKETQRLISQSEKFTVDNEWTRKPWSDEHSLLDTKEQQK
jgi:hypothetical protein